MNKKVLIVGGVAGGASAAARLRRLDEEAEIIMVERGEYISFANCGLPYYIGKVIENRSDLTLQTPSSFNSRFRIDVRILNEVVKIDREGKSVQIRDIKSGITYTESYDYLILSPGAAPIMSNIKGVNTSDKVFTLRNIPDTYRIEEFISKESPKKAIVVGGGYIGIEMAENLKQIGIDTTIVEMADQVISSLDFDMVCSVHHYIKKEGISLLLGCRIDEIRETSGGIVANLGDSEIQADMMIMAAGVYPEGELARACGIEVNERGGIIVDEYMRTCDESIYAIGDAAQSTEFVTGEKGFIPLAGPANKQGRIAADNICSIKSEFKGTQGSAILKIFDMTVASTGINERTAMRMGLDYDKSFTYSSSHASYYPGAQDICIKVIFEKAAGRILGAQVIGFEGVDKRCDVFATAIRAGMTAHDLTELELCYAPPYSSAKDPVNMAGFVIENILAGNVKNIHWHDVDALANNGVALLLDVRTSAEYNKGHIKGSINIPVDELRKRLKELDENKTVYTICHVGLRGYIASRILSQNGFDVYNLSGGYRLYRSVKMTSV